MTDPVGLELIEQRLRQLIGWRDLLAAHLTKVEADIATEGRAYADATGVKPRLTLAQLRLALNERETP